MANSQHTIAGTVLTMPVRIRVKRTFIPRCSRSMPNAAQRLVDYSGLQVCRHRPGRAVVNLMLVRYIDGDLGQYHEFGTAVMVNPPGSDAHGLRALGATPRPSSTTCRSIKAFTLEAGRTGIWGFPKIMATSAFVTMPANSRFDVSADGQHIAGIDFGRGLPVPSLFTSRPQVLKTYTLRRRHHPRGALGDAKVRGLRGRPGGATLRLGDHPYAKELASLGLPRRAMVSGAVGHVEMSFGDAQALG